MIASRKTIALSLVLRYAFRSDIYMTLNISQIMQLAIERGIRGDVKKKRKERHFLYKRE